MVTWKGIFMMKHVICSLPQTELKSNCFKCQQVFSVFTDNTTRRANGMAFEYSNKNQNSSYRGNFQWPCFLIKGKEISSRERGIRGIQVWVNWVKMTEKWGIIQAWAAKKIEYVVYINQWMSNCSHRHNFNLGTKTWSTADVRSCKWSR